MATGAASVEVVQPDAGLAAEGARLVRELGHDNVFFHVEPSWRLPFDADQFDLVVWCLALSKEPRPLGAAREVARVLRPGGRLLVQDVLAFGRPALDLWVWEWERWRDPAHRLFYREDHIEALVTLAGLAVERRSWGMLTQDFAFWADAASLDPQERKRVRTELTSLPPDDQEWLDLVLTDETVSFTYPVLTLLASPVRPR